MTECERCGDECKRRKLCYHCGHYVCGWCWRHECSCKPGHKPERCVHLQLLKRIGRTRYMRTAIARVRTMAGLPLLRGMR
jgi:hypothetical protein